MGTAKLSSLSNGKEAAQELGGLFISLPRCRKRGAVARFPSPGQTPLKLPRVGGICRIDPRIDRRLTPGTAAIADFELTREFSLLDFSIERRSAQARFREHGPDPQEAI